MHSLHLHSNCAWRSGIFGVLLLCCLVQGQDDVMEAMDIGGQNKDTDRCPVSAHAAAGDGKTLDTVAIQSAIDECSSKEDGGFVEFEAGKTYLSGSLQIPSRVTLSLPKKTILKASNLREHYPSSMKDWYFLRIEKATRVTIIGPGEISGHAQDWTYKDEGKLELKSWVSEDCMGEARLCRPGLIGIRESSQITIQSMVLKDFVGTAVHMERSDAVALIDTSISADLELEGPDGVIVDSCKRVYIAESGIQAPGFAILAETTTGAKELESLLVDGVTLKSKTAAIQVGPNIKAATRTIVIQNVEIPTCKRGISLQLQGPGSIKDVWFTNITIKAALSDNDLYGSAEAVFASVRSEYYGSQVGKMSAIWFGSIKAEMEGGMVFSGTPRSIIDGITVADSTLSLKKLSNVVGGSRDFRPAELLPDDDFYDIPIFFLEYANHVALNNTKVSFGTPRRDEWSDLIQITPKTVHSLSIEGLSMHDASAHDSEADSPMKKFAQLGDFFKHSVRDFVNSINKKGFISVQENAASGVQGRKAASSGGPIIMFILFVVVIALVFRYFCIPAWLTMQSKRER